MVEDPFGWWRRPSATVAPSARTRATSEALEASWSVVSLGPGPLRLHHTALGR